MELLRKDYYYLSSGIIFKRVETGKDEFTWWKYSNNDYVWKRVQSRDQISYLEDEHTSRFT